MSELHLLSSEQFFEAAAKARKETREEIAEIKRRAREESANVHEA